MIAGRDGPYGPGIETALQAYYSGDINHGRLYPNLDSLVDKGRVNTDEIDGRTSAYRLPQRGQRELDARREWEATYCNADDPVPVRSARNPEASAPWRPIPRHTTGRQRLHIEQP